MKNRPLELARIAVRIDGPGASDPDHTFASDAARLARRRTGNSFARLSVHGEHITDKDVTERGEVVVRVHGVGPEGPVRVREFLRPPTGATLDDLDRIVTMLDALPPGEKAKALAAAMDAHFRATMQTGSAQ